MTLLTNTIFWWCCWYDDRVFKIIIIRVKVWNFRKYISLKKRSKRTSYVSFSLSFFSLPFSQDMWLFFPRFYYYSLFFLSFFFLTELQFEKNTCLDIYVYIIDFLFFPMGVAKILDKDRKCVHVCKSCSIFCCCCFFFIHESGATCRMALFLLAYKTFKLILNINSNNFEKFNFSRSSNFVKTYFLI